MSTLTCTEALTEAYRLAVAALPADTHGRLEKALALVEAGQVVETEPGHWEVASQAEGHEPYAINGTGCPCDWAHFHPGNRCTHQLAVLLQRKTLALMAQPIPELEAPVAAPVAESPAVLATLPEAPSSCNVRVEIAGRDVQITLRDTDETRLLVRLEALLQRYPAPTKAQPAATEGGPRCPDHGKMKQGKRGWYCPRKTDEGQWCSYRVKGGGQC
jgi:hypothetical protein